MSDRFCLRALLFAGLLLPLVSCSSPSLTTIVISPTTYTALAAPYGDPQVTTYFTATGYYGHAGHQTTADITNEVVWYSYTPAMVTVISCAGVPGCSHGGTATVTGAMYGSTQLSASAPGYNGSITSNAASFSVTAPNSTTNSDIVSIAVVPATPTVATTSAPVGFTAIGTTGTGIQVNLTSVSLWTSSNTGIATIGLHTGAGTTVAAGSTAIAATYTNPNDSMQVTGYTILTVQ